MFYLRTKAQSTLEYVILLGFVIAALIAMGVYMKRGTEGKLRESTDQIGEQYEAGKTTGTYTVNTDLAQREQLNSGSSTGAGHITTEIIRNTQKKSGSETVVGIPAE